MSRDSRTWDALVAQFSPKQVAAVDAFVTEAGELTDDQIHTLRPLFSGAGERVVAARAADEPGHAA
jgi:hypothetical protein